MNKKKLCNEFLQKKIAEINKYQSFMATQQGPFGDWLVEVFGVINENRGTMMCVPTEQGPVYITKQQAMDFFGLVEAP